MGTNYYVEWPKTSPLPAPRLHVGKSSAGWVFCFRAYGPDDGVGLDAPLTTTQAWRTVLDAWIKYGDAILLDEYGDRRYLDEFWRMVESKYTWNGQPALCRDGCRADEGNDFASYEFS